MTKQALGNTAKEEQGHSFGGRISDQETTLFRKNPCRPDPKSLSNSPSRLGLPVVGSEEIAHPAQVVH
jgi:hypothetical protein